MRIELFNVEIYTYRHWYNLELLALSDLPVTEYDEETKVRFSWQGNGRLLYLSYIDGNKNPFYWDLLYWRYFYHCWNSWYIWYKYCKEHPVKKEN